jgi:hypothetical protein
MKERGLSRIALFESLHEFRFKSDYMAYNELLIIFGIWVRNDIRKPLKCNIN